MPYLRTSGNGKKALKYVLYVNTHSALKSDVKIINHSIW